MNDSASRDQLPLNRSASRYHVPNPCPHQTPQHPILLTTISLVNGNTLASHGWTSFRKISLPIISLAWNNRWMWRHLGEVLSADLQGGTNLHWKAWRKTNNIILSVSKLLIANDTDCHTHKRQPLSRTKRFTHFIRRPCLWTVTGWNSWNQAVFTRSRWIHCSHCRCCLSQFNNRSLIRDKIQFTVKNCCIEGLQMTKHVRAKETIEHFNFGTWKFCTMRFPFADHEIDVTSFLVCRPLNRRRNLQYFVLLAELKKTIFYTA